MTARCEVVNVPMARPRVEGRCVRQTTMARRKAVIWIASWLPVDGLHAILEMRRRPELPLSDDSPNNGDTGNGRRNDNEDGDGGLFRG
jgi:hypothetical protein